MFTNHINNLQFINQALSDLSWYWSLVEQIRMSAMNSTLAKLRDSNCCPTLAQFDSRNT
jgi:hypothetical protein